MAGAEFASSYLTVGLDGSPSAAAALDWALAEAARRRLAVQLVSVWGTPLTVAGPVPTLAVPAMAASARAAAQHAVDAAAKRAADAGVVSTTEVVEGEPAEVLVALASGADQLVVGARGRSALVRHLLGSVSTAAVHHATRPVTVVRGASAHPHHRIVVGVDGSTYSATALQRAVLEATSARSPLTVVTAWHAMDADLLGDFGGLVVPDDDELSGLAELRARRAMQHAGVPGCGIPVHLAVRHGNAADVLRDESAHADLLVVGTHGWGAFDRVMFGSTSTTLLHHAGCPVQVVPSDRSVPKR